MPMQNIFPQRFGLQVPRGENLQAVEVFSEGGLDFTQSIIESRPGCASNLINFEISRTGGYRRIDGYDYYSITIVPGQGSLLGVFVFYTGQVLAARQDATDSTKYNIYYGTGAGWTKINSSNLTYSSGMVLNFSSHNWNGTLTATITDGVNPAYQWDGTNYTVLNAAGSAADPKFSFPFHGYLFVSGYSSNSGAVKFSAPLNAADWTPIDGAGEIVVGNTVTGMASWRDQLIIFCTNSIHKIALDSTGTFQVSPITYTVGCVEGRTIKEIDGDLVYLASDGIRTISGTFNIGDTEIASISRPIQQLVLSINPNITPLHSLVVHRKTQYRIYYPDNTVNDADCKGIVGGLRRFRDGHEAWEWGELAGVRPACCHSGYMNNGQEFVLHGGTDGYVYRHDNGATSFGGRSINEAYSTVPLELGDSGLRKVIHRVTVYAEFEKGSGTLTLSLQYDYGKFSNTKISYAIDFSNSNTVKFDTGIVFDTGAKFNAGGLPLARQNVQGSGFIAQLGLSSFLNTNPYVIQGYYIEYFPAGRR